MPGNSFGKSFVVTTFGESHGIALGVIIDGCPPNLELDEKDIQKELDKRRPGTSKYVTQRKEKDKAQILSGVFEGKTTGTPITIIIFNEDQRSKDYGNIKDKFRPGHADYPYLMKYGIRDYRGGGRSSARETVARVASGAVAKKLLTKYANIKIFCYVSQIGELKTNFESEEYIYHNPFAIANNKQIDEVANYLDEIRKNHNSVGAKLTVVAKNVPVGLGEPVFDKLDGDIAKAIMSINAVKAVEIGDGFLVSEKMGTQNNDMLTSKGFLSNHSGGILGGLSTGQDIIVNFAIKPTSSISVEQDTIDINGSNTKIITKGRHDPCVALRAPVIAESMLALVLIDHILRDRAQCVDIQRKIFF